MWKYNRPRSALEYQWGDQRRCTKLMDIYKRYIQKKAIVIQAKGDDALDKAERRGIAENASAPGDISKEHQQ